MAIATKATTYLTITPITQTSLLDAIKLALENAGFPTTPFDNYTDGSNIKWLVYEVVNDAAKSKGKQYFHVSVSTSLVVRQKISDDGNAATHAYTINSSFSASITFTTTSTIQLTAFNHPELRCVIVEQGATAFVGGYFRPANKPSWWNEDVFSYGFCFSDATVRSFYAMTTTNSPYAHTASNTYNVPVITQMSVANPVTSKRDVLPGWVVYSSGNAGIAGKTSDDFVLVSSTNLFRYDVVQLPEGEEYTLLGTNNSTSSVAIRTA